ncbi:potassium-transporting ATPase subunit KdpA [Spirosoma utsteinense]|uniref:Potassium-transporting ATPase potassium-binding subunit n=1 Tax=Spirosoma utsteinense TaxID=2585773 RepID=A0ABR6W936_9BACT|nr:potassium-transporting ATPase subunit KdpA [Spirosoma utsteinense]MBC3787363.1 K+-transporting ATPase ATPase A chain [Spirosoma utsteinense]MBC3793083.1 K+-transporting ATPase ATPase A chain [Spirosoma utsteinense]
MTTEWMGVIAMYGLTVLLAIPLGKFLATVFKGEPNAFDFMKPLERLIYRLGGVDETANLSWQQNLRALLTINLVWLVLGFTLLVMQGSLPLNPDGNPSQTLDLAFNTAISFLVNCDLQHYSGETGLTYLTQLAVITFLMFTSAATGIAAAVLLFRSFIPQTAETVGNFYVLFTRAITRLLLPGALVISLVLVFSGVPASFDGRDTIITLQGDTVGVSRGPAAGMIAIKHLGTNGGGWFGANSAHPLENPTYLTNMVEMVAQMLIPVAMIFALGFFVNRKRFAWMIYAVMTIGFFLLLIPTIISELGGNPAITHMGISQSTGAMEGKEVRFGPLASAYWSIATTVISTGSVNSMHDSSMPLSGTMELLGMMVNAFYGGAGAGLLNFYYFLIIAVFISGLMVGRTPELFGRKVEAREIKIASLVALLSALLVKGGTALSAWIFVRYGGASDWAVAPSAWLNNPGFHGFTEMLYEFTSANANNGSGFEGLGDNNFFWNYATGIVLLFGRFIPIVGPVAIAGLLARKKCVPASSGTLPVDTPTFGLMIFAVIFILTALSFFPALTLGPLAEFFSLK